MRVEVMPKANLLLQCFPPRLMVRRAREIVGKPDVSGYFCDLASSSVVVVSGNISVADRLYLGGGPALREKQSAQKRDPVRDEVRL